MQKYRIGDKVLIIKNNKVGVIYNIVNYYNNMYAIRYECNTKHIEFISKKDIVKIDDCSSLGILYGRIKDQD